MPVTLMYHDVVPAGDFNASGFRGAGADHYKLTVDEFSAHIQALAASQNRFVGPDQLRAELDQPSSGTVSRLLTFDDGGVSASRIISRLIESRGWTGYFFITTDRIGADGFMNAGQIRELHQRGHVVGTHSCSHPPRLSSCSFEQIKKEWQASRAILEQIIEAPVTSASVPGGFYSPTVGKAAAAAGIQWLFTSEPTTSVASIDGCRLLGRYAIVQSTTPDVAVALALGSGGARLKQWTVWNLKKAFKFLLGGAYDRFRTQLLRPKGTGA